MIANMFIKLDGRFAMGGIHRYKCHQDVPESREYNFDKGTDTNKYTFCACNYLHPLEILCPPCMSAEECANMWPLGDLTAPSVVEV